MINQTPHFAVTKDYPSISIVSGHLTAPCRDFGKSADVDRFDEIGSHIWSII